MRKILDEFVFMNITRDVAVDDSEPLRIYILGPSDKASHRFADKDVVRLEWRSPFGDDLQVDIERDWLINAIHKEELTK